MCKVILKTGAVLSAYLVTAHQFPQPQVHIYPENLTISEIYQYFDNEEATSEITIETEEVDPVTGETKKNIVAYTGYTDLFSVQRSAYHPDKKEYMVWMQRPVETM